MRNQILLEDITENSHRDAYRKLVDLEKNMYRSNLINWICILSNFEPDNFIGWYHKRRTFSDKQISFIDGVYTKVESHRTANQRYTQEGYRDELIEVMEQIAEDSVIDTKNVHGTRGQLRAKITELRRGQMVYNRYFVTADKCLKVVPEEQKQQLADRLNVLKEKYWEIYREVRVQP